MSIEDIRRKQREDFFNINIDKSNEEKDLERKRAFFEDFMNKNTTPPDTKTSSGDSGLFMANVGSNVNYENDLAKKRDNFFKQQKVNESNKEKDLEKKRAAFEDFMNEKETSSKEDFFVTMENNNSFELEVKLRQKEEDEKVAGDQSKIIPLLVQGAEQQAQAAAAAKKEEERKRYNGISM